jgi:phosphatidate cytidylyltransferase
MSEPGWGDLKKRSIFSTAIIASVFFLIFYSQILWVRLAVALVILGVIGVAAAELALLGRSKQLAISLFWIVASSIFLGASFFFASQSPYFQTLPLFAFFFILLFFFLRSFSKVDGALTTTSFSLFSLIYAALPLSLLFFILFSPFVDGRLWIAYLLMVTKMGDIAAYFGGKLLGKRKLAPRLSPKKTWEGATFGGLMSVAVSLLFFYGSRQWGWSGFDLSWKEALVLGVLMSFFGQLGDLAESLLKRDANVKDSNCLPGLGGVLDMVDSLLFAIPLLYLFLISR